MQNNSIKVGIVGFGYIGSVIGAVIADRGNTVVGIEKDPRILNAVSNAQAPFGEPGLQDLITSAVSVKSNLTITNNFSSVADCDVIIITVGTPLSDSGEPDLTQIKMASQEIAPFLKDGQLVCLKSTVPPFTTENIVAPILRQYAKVAVAFSPERLAEGKAIDELNSIPIVVGGVDAESTKSVSQFWRDILGNKVIEVENARTAEMVKLADNLWIDLNIALAQEIAKLSEKLKIDALEVIAAANTLPKGNYNVNILTPSVGVGGYCLTKDPWFVHRLGNGFGLDLQTPQTSRKVNDGMPEYCLSLIDEVLLTNGRKPQDCKIAVLGVAFKSNTGDCRFSPTKPLIDSFLAKGYRIEMYDPWVAEHDVKLITSRTLNKNMHAVIDGADCVAFLTGHNEFHELSSQDIAKRCKQGALIFDGRMYFTKVRIKEFKDLGLVYKGVGRC